MTYETLKQEAEKYFESSVDIKAYVQYRLEGMSAPEAFARVIDDIVHQL